MWTNKKLYDILAEIIKEEVRRKKAEDEIEEKKAALNREIRNENIKRQSFLSFHKVELPTDLSITFSEMCPLIPIKNENENKQPDWVVFEELKNLSVVEEASKKREKEAEVYGPTVNAISKDNAKALNEIIGEFLGKKLVRKVETNLKLGSIILAQRVASHYISANVKYSEDEEYIIVVDEK